MPGRALRLLIAGLVAVALAAGGVELLVGHASAGGSGHGTVGPKGGTVTTGDGTVSVAFRPGEADAGTRVDITTGGAGVAPPPAMVRPLGQPFAITPAGGRARTGTVTVRYGHLPASARPAQIVMVINDGAGKGWQLLNTTTTVATGSATAVWPHFSRGFLGYLDPLFNPLRNGTSWTWGEIKPGVDWLGQEYANYLKWEAGGTLKIFGGNPDNVRCPEKSDVWGFVGTNLAGGHMNLPPLNGCAEAADGATGMSRVNIGNHYPYPYLLTLPSGVHANWRDIVTNTGLGVPETLLNFVLARFNRVIVPGGGQAVVQFDPSVPYGTRITGLIDPITEVLKVVALAALFVSRGDTAADAVALKAEKDALEEKLLTDPAYSLSNFIFDTRWDSKTARKERELAFKGNVGALDELFNTIDLLSCAYQQLDIATQQAGGNGNGWDAVSAAVDGLSKTCWPVWVKATVDISVGAALKNADPATKAKEGVKLAQGVLSQLQDLPQVSLAADAAQIKFLSRGHFDYLHAALVATPALSKLHARDYVLTESPATAGFTSTGSPGSGVSVTGVTDTDFAACLDVPADQIFGHVVDSAYGRKFEFGGTDGLWQTGVISGAYILPAAEVARLAAIAVRPQYATCAGRLLPTPAPPLGWTTVLDSAEEIAPPAGATAEDRRTWTVTSSNGVTVTTDMIYVMSGHVVCSIWINSVNELPNSIFEQDLVGQIAQKIARQ
jgi:hypothetical protein